MDLEVFSRFLLLITFTMQVIFVTHFPPWISKLFKISYKMLLAMLRWSKAKLRR